MTKQRQIDALVKALQLMVDHYVDLANSGDCGCWNPGEESVVKLARTTLALVKEGKP